MGIDKKVFAFALMVIISLSMMFNSMPMVSAAYYVQYPFMPPDLEGDCNVDGIVDIYDLIIVGAAYGSHPGEPAWDPRADLNRDGVVDIYDMIIAGNNIGHVEAEPIAYSTTFDYTVPSDIDEQVNYYVLARVYVPPELSGRTFYFVATADDGVQDVKLNRVSKAGSGGSVNINLGSLSGGYYLLEFVFYEHIQAGALSFHVETAASEYAWLPRFRVYVPDYDDTDTEHRYTVRTQTYFRGDAFFLGGYADDFIDDVQVQVGLIWQDWEWDMGPAYGAIYAWGDGFMYPLFWQENWKTITFIFGEIREAGLLDFQYISWTEQRDRIGPPKFRASAKFTPPPQTPLYPANISQIEYFAGSKWYDEGNPENSERYYETRLRIYAYSNRWVTTFDRCFEVGLGVGWAEWILPPATIDDLGITLNFTCLELNANRSPDYASWWAMYLRGMSLDIYSCQNLEIPSIEYYPEGESKVKQDLRIALDFAGTVIMFASAAVLPTGIPVVIGGLVGLGIKGLAAGYHYLPDQPLIPFGISVGELNHKKLVYNRAPYMLGSLGFAWTNDPPYDEPTGSKNDLVFFKLDPKVGKTCGLVKVVLRGDLEIFYGASDIYTIWPVGTIEIEICMPWFSRGAE